MQNFGIRHSSVSSRHTIVLRDRSRAISVVITSACHLDLMKRSTRFSRNVGIRRFNVENSSKRLPSISLRLSSGSNEKSVAQGGLDNLNIKAVQLLASTENEKHLIENLKPHVDQGHTEKCPSQRKTACVHRPWPIHPCHRRSLIESLDTSRTKESRRSRYPCTQEAQRQPSEGRKAEIESRCTSSANGAQRLRDLTSGKYEHGD